MDNLTIKQREALQKIKELTRNGKAVTLEELKRSLGYTSTGVTPVKKSTDALKEKGYLVNEKGLRLKDLSNKVQIPLVGMISCGQPLLAIENTEAYIPYDSNKIKGLSSDYFFLRANGDSMNKADINGKNIDDGDFVLVKKQQTAKPGERIVALIGDEATIKLLKKGEGCMVLQPESKNLANKPIYLFEDFSVQGIVQDVLKKGGDN